MAEVISNLIVESTMPNGLSHGGVDTIHTKVFLTSLSAMVAETITFPIDMIKTRLQLHGESLSSSHPTSAFRVGLGIIREQGALGLYSGLSPAIFRHMFYTPIRIVGYENLRNVVSADNASISIVGKAVVGGISGVVAQFQISQGHARAKLIVS
ncbi:Mitochondrial uncoupling protein 3 [Glycine soja]